MNVAASTVNVLSLCSGYGGLDLGLDIATGGATRTVCYVEREAFCAAILASRMAEEALDEAPVWSDLRSFDGRPWRGLVDCITGGYPCQPFSVAGKRLGEEDERHLWPDIARIIGEVEPGIVFFENVAGHVTLGFDVVRDDLERLGYRVAAGLFAAEEVGASHCRERLFILGVAHPGRKGREGCERGRSLYEPRTSAQGSDGECGDLVADAKDVKASGEVLAHAIGHDDGRGGSAGDMDAGPEADSRGRGDVAERSDDLYADLGAFPPRPESFDEWNGIIAVKPDLAPTIEPDVRGVDDGRASRLDRLRALGNGVVPLQAAYAFVSLWACLDGGEA